MKNSVTITEIAKATKFSISTVSKAFSNSTDISESAKAEIIKYALEIGYIANKKNKKTKGKIAVVVAGLDYADTNSFIYQLIFGFKLAAASKNYDVEIIIKDSYTWSLKQNVLDCGFNGAFLLSMTYNHELIDEVQSSKIPLVLFDQHVESENCACIGCDNSSAMSIAVKHLISLGHSKIAFLGGTPMAFVSIERKNGFINAIQNNGLTLYPDLIFETDFMVDYSHIVVPKVIKEGATAIVCSSDVLARFTINKLKSMSLDVPRDISVIGYDNVPFCEEMNPKLTSISQGSLDIGRSAFYLLTQLLKKVKIHEIKFKPDLIVRDSTRSPVPTTLDK